MNRDADFVPAVELTRRLGHSLSDVLAVLQHAVDTHNGTGHPRRARLLVDTDERAPAPRRAGSPHRVPANELEAEIIPFALHVEPGRPAGLAYVTRGCVVGGRWGCTLYLAQSVAYRRQPTRRLRWLLYTVWIALGVLLAISNPPDALGFPLSVVGFLIAYTGVCAVTVASMDDDTEPVNPATFAGLIVNWGLDCLPRRRGHAAVTHIGTRRVEVPRTASAA